MKEMVKWMMHSAEDKVREKLELLLRRIDEDGISAVEELLKSSKREGIRVSIIRRALEEKGKIDEYSIWTVTRASISDAIGFRISEGSFYGARRRLSRMAKSGEIMNWIKKKKGAFKFVKTDMGLERILGLEFDEGEIRAITPKGKVVIYNKDDCILEYTNG